MPIRARVLPLLVIPLLASLALMAGLLTAPVATAQTAPDRAGTEAIIRDYLLKNPEVLQEAMTELERRQREAESAAVKRITGDAGGKLYISEHHTLVGNPEGDASVVVFFDYNCGYCKRGLADLQKLLDTDKRLRIVLKEFPILSPGSRDASVVALALRPQFDKDKLWKFHSALLSTRGQVGKEQALGVAKDLGADMKKLETEMQSPKIALALEESKTLADALNISGTPSYVVAEDLIIGARGYDELARRVASWRKCRKAEC